MENVPKFSVNYTKPKPIDIATLEEKDVAKEHDYYPFHIEHLQSYNPTYSLFFDLTEQNYNRIALNNRYHIRNPGQVVTADLTVEEKPIFIKFSPLLDPLRYMIGKYEILQKDQNPLPSLAIPEIETQISQKIYCTNNASYVDCFFSYLTSQLLHTHGFIHGTDFYGSFLGVQEKYRINVIDDYEYLQGSSFFASKKGKLFEVDDSMMNEMFDYGSRKNKQKLQIQEDDDAQIVADEICEIISTVDCSGCDLVLDYEKDNASRSSVGSDNSSDNYSSDESKDTEWTDDDESSCSLSSSSADEEKDEISEEEETLFAYIHNFPVQMICMEKCDGTLDELFMKDIINERTGASALFQIVMILIAYQKSLLFTHNDLHTNNIMYVKTEEEFLYYVYREKLYKVPTYGRIYKMIDFGRGCYQFQGRTFCSDSFAPGGDAATQYNFEPFYNKKKPLLEPNYSFDLCRLGTSIYDFLIDENEDCYQLNELQSTIYRWCLDDNGKNVLYKKTGEERYPNFKLYKMIARNVHNHTPERQLEFPFFNQFEISAKLKCKLIETVTVINLDQLPTYF